MSFGANPPPTTPTATGAAPRRRAGWLLAAVAGVAGLALVASLALRRDEIVTRRAISRWRAEVVEISREQGIDVADLRSLGRGMVVPELVEGQVLILREEIELFPDGANPQPLVAPGDALFTTPRLETVRALRDHLRDEDPIVRHLAVLYLAAMKDQASLDDIVETLATDSSVWVRWRAARELGLSRHEPAIEVLADLFDHEDAELRGGVRSALLGFGPRATAAVLARLPEVTDPELRRQRIEFLLEGDKWSMDDGHSIGPALLPVVAAAEEDDVVRSVAAIVLASFGIEEAIEPLVAVLAEERIRHRDLCLPVKESLAILGEPAVAALAARLTASSDPHHRQNILWALMRPGVESAVPAMEAALADEDPTTRQHAISALRQAGRRPATE